MERIFIGSEMIASGDVTPYELRKHFRRVFPDVYGPRRGVLTLAERTKAAWLWSRRDGVVSGLAASAMWGAKWIDVDTPVELNWPGHKARAGVATRRDTLLDGEVTAIGPIAVTTAARTAFDLARHGPVGEAVARLDALARATHFKAQNLQAVANLHPHVKGLRRIDRILDLVDAGAESPKETWLRMLLIDGGLPRPQTQIPVLAPDGYPRYFLDMGWPDLMIAVEYDGEQHRTKRSIYGNDIVRSEYIAHVGWTRIRVIAGNSRSNILSRVNRAWPR